MSIFCDLLVWDSRMEPADGWDWPQAAYFENCRRCTCGTNSEEAADVIEKLVDEIDRVKREHVSAITPCDLCIHNPPSSFGGKPCTTCPAEGGSK